jgi:hypothetical protein
MGDGTLGTARDAIRGVFCHLKSRMDALDEAERETRRRLDGAQCAQQVQARINATLESVASDIQAAYWDAALEPPRSPFDDWPFRFLVARGAGAAVWSRFAASADSSPIGGAYRVLAKQSAQITPTVVASRFVLKREGPDADARPVVVGALTHAPSGGAPSGACVGGVDAFFRTNKAAARDVFSAPPLYGGALSGWTPLTDPTDARDAADARDARASLDRATARATARAEILGVQHSTPRGSAVRFLALVDAADAPTRPYRVWERRGARCAVFTLEPSGSLAAVST